MITETLLLTPLFFTLSGSPNLSENNARFVVDARELTSTKIDSTLEQFVQTNTRTTRNELLNLFGSVRDFNDEEREIYDRVVEKMSKKTGINIFELI